MLRKLAAMPNRVRYSVTLGPFCGAGRGQRAVLPAAGWCGGAQPAWEVKATEKSRMPAETTDRLSWVQKLSQPTRWHALAVRSSDFLAGSDMVMTCGLVAALQATCTRRALASAPGLHSRPGWPC